VTVADLDWGGGEKNNAPRTDPTLVRADPGLEDGRWKMEKLDGEGRRNVPDMEKPKLRADLGASPHVAALPSSLIRHDSTLRRPSTSSLSFGSWSIL